jgi:hypothetical protein
MRGSILSVAGTRCMYTISAIHLHGFVRYTNLVIHVICISRRANTLLTIEETSVETEIA